MKMGLIQREFWKIKTKIAPKSFEMMHLWIDPAGNECLNITCKHENSRTDQGKGYQARQSFRTMR